MLDTPASLRCPAPGAANSEPISHIATKETTVNGAPRKAPYQRQSCGKVVNVSARKPAAMAALIHHGWRSRIANSEFSAIVQRMRPPPGSRRV